MKKYISTILLCLFVIIVYPQMLKAEDATQGQTTVTPSTYGPPSSSGSETKYTLLAPIPLNGASSKPTDTATATQYIRGLFKLIIGIAGALAVVMLIYAGIQYMSTDAFSSKNEAKKTIENALWGLLLAISAYVILNTINPELVKINFSLEPLKISEESMGDNTGGGAIPVTNGGACGSDCVTPTIGHKQPGNGPGSGCLAPGPCIINGALNSKLNELVKTQSDLFITEMYPPTVPHKDPCHNNGTCVDVTVNSYSVSSVKKFLEDARSAGLSVLVEVDPSYPGLKKSLNDAGIPAITTAGNGTHYHIK